jgi:restriction system protein
MPVPDFQTMMLPLLKFASDGLERNRTEALEYLATHFQLLDQDRNEQGRLLYVRDQHL